MSYSDPAANFAPPPPPAARRSPWMWVGIGCGTIVALLAILIAIGANKFKNDFAQPFDAKAAVTSMQGFPVYPDAKLDETMSKVQQTTFKLIAGTMPADSINVIAYKVPGPSEQVITWYDNATEKKGYKIAASTDESIEKFSRGTKQSQYTKGKDRYLVQVQKDANNTGQLYLIIVRLVNFRGS